MKIHSSHFPLGRNSLKVALDTFRELWPSQEPVVVICVEYKPLARELLKDVPGATFKVIYTLGQNDWFIVSKDGLDILDDTPEKYERKKLKKEEVA